MMCMGRHMRRCPFELGVLPITGMKGCPGRCPFRLRILPITGMRGCPGRCPFRLRILPIVGIGGRSGRCPSLITVLPTTNPASCPLLVRVLPMLSTGHFSYIFWFQRQFCLFWARFLHTLDILSTLYKVQHKCADHAESRNLFTENNPSDLNL